MLQTKEYHMYQLLFVLNIIHRTTLIALLAIFAIAPLVSNTGIFINYVLLPVLFILISLTTVYIENRLNKYKTQINVTRTDKKQKKCLIHYGICCLHQ